VAGTDPRYSWPFEARAEFLDNLVGAILDLDRTGNPVPARREAKRPDGGKFRQKQDCKFPKK